MRGGAHGAGTRLHENPAGHVPRVAYSGPELLSATNNGRGSLTDLLEPSTRESIGVLSLRLRIEAAAGVLLSTGALFAGASAGGTGWDMIDEKPTELALIEERLWVVSRRTGLAVSAGLSFGGPEVRVQRGWRAGVLAHACSRDVSAALNFCGLSRLGM